MYSRKKARATPTSKPVRRDASTIMPRRGRLGSRGTNAGEIRRASGIASDLYFRVLQFLGNGSVRRVCDIDIRLPELQLALDRRQ